MDDKIFKELESNLKKAVKVAKGELAPKKRYHVLTPADIKAIRLKIHLSQKAFAEKFNLPVDTLKGWEQGKRALDAAQSNYLRMIDRDPEYVSESLELAA